MKNCYNCFKELSVNNWSKYCNTKNILLCLNCFKLNRRTKRRQYEKERRKDPKINARKKELKRKNKLKIRIEILEAYGEECAHCGEGNIFHLTLDHINNDGYLDKKEIGAGTELYAHLKKLGYPGKGTKYQILCHNCNALKEMTRRFKKDDPNFEFPKFKVRDQSNVLNCRKAKEVGIDKIYEIISQYKAYQ